MSDPKAFDTHIYFVYTATNSGSRHTPPAARVYYLPFPRTSLQGIKTYQVPLLCPERPKAIDYFFRDRWPSIADHPPRWPAPLECPVRWYARYPPEYHYDFTNPNPNHPCVSRSVCRPLSPYTRAIPFLGNFLLPRAHAPPQSGSLERVR